MGKTGTQSKVSVIVGEAGRNLIFAAALMGLLAAFVFVGFPGLDIAAAKPFFLGPRNFLLNHYDLAKFIRLALQAILVFGAVIAASGIALGYLRGVKLFGIGSLKWVYLALCLVIGPGLIANVIFKDNWGRARPLHSDIFGGAQKFTPVLVHSNACKKNCSFVSGEASSIFMLFFSLGLIMPLWRRRLYVAALLGGTGAGIIRLGQGGHYISDTIFAGVLMALTAGALYWVMFERRS